MTSKKEIIAYDLYMNTHLSQKEIAAIAGFSPQYLSSLISKKGWKFKKELNNQRFDTILKNHIKILIEYQEWFLSQDVEFRAKNSPSYADATRKIHASIRESKKTLTFQDYYDVIDNLQKYVGSQPLNSDLKNKVLSLFKDFLTNKAEEFSI